MMNGSKGNGDTEATAQKHLPYLDGWRGISILAVLFGHFNIIPSILGHGFEPAILGVELFFVLSGRLMAEILFVRRVPLGQFYWRRASRILPAYWLFLVVMIVSHGTILQGCSLSDASKALLFFTNYSPRTIAPPLTHLWSLCVEEHSYLLLSVIALSARRFEFEAERVLGLIAALAMISGLIQRYVGVPDIYFHTDVRIASVFCSAATFLYFRKRPITNAVIPIIFTLAGCVVFLLNFPSDTVRFTAGTILLSIGIANLEGWWMPARKLLEGKPIRILGIWSFSLYLVQQPFFLINAEHPSWLPWLLALTFAWGIGSFYFIERPSRRWLNSLLTKDAVAGIRPAESARR